MNMDFKATRKQLIRMTNSIKEFNPRTRSQSVVQKNLEEASALCGMFLGIYGISETPYKNDGNRHTSEDIEPTFDNTDQPLYLGKNRIEVFDTLRQDLSRITEELIEAEKDARGEPESWFKDTIYNLLLQKLILARLWGGYELREIKEKGIL